ncbi:hypothetical protein ACEWY4_015074 [Coilia grayii]|uniref:CASAMP N-terminal domain-containing protein n=1 Tax=Coilia grayii TaxID=363190 RepID=A0ABD1JU22_9TELE
MGDLVDSKEIKKTFIVPAIKSFEHYDFNRAKISSSLTWLVSKAYGAGGVPGELKEPFYTDQYEQEHLKPPLVGLLLSAELYGRAASRILTPGAPDADPLRGHEAVIRALAHRGLYVADQERLVTERDLSKRPIQMCSPRSDRPPDYMQEERNLQELLATLQGELAPVHAGKGPPSAPPKLRQQTNEANPVALFTARRGVAQSGANIDPVLATAGRRVPHRAPAQSHSGDSRVGGPVAPKQNASTSTLPRVLKMRTPAA